MEKIKPKVREPTEILNNLYYFYYKNKSKDYVKRIKLPERIIKSFFLNYYSQCDSEELVYIRMLIILFKGKRLYTLKQLKDIPMDNIQYYEEIVKLENQKLNILTLEKQNYIKIITFISEVNKNDKIY